MSASGRGDPWGVSLEIGVGGNPRFPDDERSRNVEDVDPAALSFSTTPRDDAATTHHSWLLPNPHAAVKTRKRYVDLGCFMVSRPIFLGAIGALLLFTVIAAIVVTVKKDAPPHHHPIPPPDNYTVALHKALMFFNAQRSGPLPRDNNVTWRGNSGMKDGMSEDHRNLVGGFYDAGSAAKYNFPASFAMTMLSWSVIEYRFKYEAMGELDHVKEIIKWGVDYLLKSFNASAPTVDHIVTQVGGGSATDRNPNDDFCWMRPEDVDYPHQVHECYVCSDLAAEMAAALASASIVFKDSDTYSRMLVHRAEMLWKFAKRNQGVYGGGDGARFYSSTGFFDEFVWSGTWLYFATGNNSYLSALAGDIANGNQSLGDPAYGVLSWDKKLIGAKVLLTRLRMFLSPGYPYEEILAQFHNQTNIVMCSYLPVFTSFGRTKGGMILLNNGEPQPLQYVVSAAFLASLYGDYLETVDTPGWFCGPDFYSTDILRDFARTQINYVLGVNPRNMSYVVGFGSQYPKRVHHRGASIPKNGVKYGCQEGWRWRDSNSPNPHVIVGAMVSGPDKQDGFHDDRKNYNYTEPTLAANAGLVAALVSLSGEPAGLDRNNIFSSVEPMFPKINYVLGVNPRNMSYVVGFGSQYPKHVHHRGASIPKNGVKYGCQEGWRWRDSNSPNPNVIVGAMVSGPDKQDGFHDDRKNYNYTEPTLATNAGLVAALVSLSGEPVGLDRNNIFSSVEPMFPKVTPSSPPWQP